MAAPEQTPAPGGKAEANANNDQVTGKVLPFLAEQGLLTMATSAGVGVIVYDRDFCFLFWNAFMENLTGRKAGEVLGGCALDLFPHLREQGVDRFFQEALAGKTVTSGDIPFTIPGTGKSGWVQGIYSPHVDKEGAIVGLVGIIHDITTRKTLEQELRTKEEFLRGVLDSVQDGISVLDRDLNIMLTNPSLETLFPQQLPLRGKKCFQAYHQQDKACVPCPAVKAMRTGVRQSKIAPYPDDQNPTNWLEVIAFPLRNTQREIIGAVELARDITEKQKNDETLARQKTFLETVINALPHPFYVINAADYRIVMANTQTSPRQDWQGLTCHQLSHHRDTPCDEAEHRCPLHEVKRTGQPVILEHMHFDAQGDKRYIEVHGYPIFDNHGQVVQIIEYGLDITERHLFEEERNQLIVDLQHALKEVKTLSGMLPICAWCKKIRDDKGYWNQLESYMAKHTKAQFSHSICPDCMQTNFQDPDDEK